MISFSKREHCLFWKIEEIREYFILKVFSCSDRDRKKIIQFVLESINSPLHFMAKKLVIESFFSCCPSLFKFMIGHKEHLSQTDCSKN